MAEVAQAQAGGLMSIGSVAAHNLAATLNLPASSVGTIEQAIKDEIGAMSSHFTLAVADVQTQYDIEVAKIKSDFVWLKANKPKVVAAVAVVLAFGIGFGHFVHFV